MLWIALHFPRLALEALPPAPASPEPWAITDGACVLVCNRQAQARGVRDDMRLSAACALVPELRHRPRDTDAEAVALDTLAAWAGRFTPNVSL